jgi:subtilisin family serine protease
MLKKIMIGLSFLMMQVCWAVDRYNPITNHLTIQTVQVGETFYNNVVITVGTVLQVGGGDPIGSVDVYNSTNNQLTIPSVMVNGTSYTNVVISVGQIVSIEDSSSYALTTPIKLAKFPIIGSASYPQFVSDYGVGSVYFPQSNALGGYGYADAIYNASTSPLFQIYPITHLTNEITAAWASGWTGVGVTISVIDDFTNVVGSVKKETPVIKRTAVYEVTTSDFGKVQGSYDMVYSWSSPWTHGSLVANIAGGDYDGQQVTSKSIITTVKSAFKSACETLRPGPNRYTISCDSDFYIQTLGSNVKTFDLAYKKVAGIAKQSNVVNNNVNLSSLQNPLQTVADIQGHLKNSSYLGVVNLSLGAQIPTSGKTFSQVMNEVEKKPLAALDSVITVAAGNGGAPCATQDLNGCNSIAVAMAFQRSTKDNAIVVGATEGTGSSENIAIYSTRAGILADRFILASGDGGDEGISGTSFAAPRVAGVAAIIKQKFPTLTAAQIANIILLSASKDINNDGFDDFKGISPIYGHGKLSLSRALNLAGAI